MMRAKLFLFLIILLALPQISAISLTDIKEVYQPGETLITEVSGNILSGIEKEDIQLKRKNVQVPFDYDIKKLGDKYYLYAVMPSSENNYTLIIKDVQTTQEGSQITIDFIQNLTVMGNIAPYTLTPGIVSTKENFKIKLTLNSDEEQSINLDFPNEYDLLLEPGDNVIDFSIDDFPEGLTFVNIGIYSLPVFSIKEKEEQKDYSIPLRFFPLKIESTILLGSRQEYPIKIINVGSQEIRDIEFSYDDRVFYIQPEKIDSLSPNDEAVINLSFRKEASSKISDTLIAKSGNYEIKLPIEISTTQSESAVSTPYLQSNFSGTNGFYCEELSGSVCSASQVCNGNVLKTLDENSCCIGSCVSKETSSTSSWAGYLLGGILLIILILIYIKYKKSKGDGEGNPLFKRFKK